MSNEIKIGLLAIVTIALTLWGYKFVEGQNLLSKSKVLMVEYDNVGGLTEGTTVMRSGVQVGLVTAVYLNPENLRTVVVELDIDRDLPIPKDAIAEIATTDLLGAKNVQLRFNGPCSGTNCAESGDYLTPGTKSVLATMVGSADEVGAYVEVLTKGLKEVVDSLGQSVGDENSALGKTFADVDAILQNLKATTANLNGLIARNSGEINSIVKDLNSLSSSIQGREAELQRILTNADTLMQNLARIDFNATMDSAEGAIGNLNTTLASANNAVKDLQGITNKLSQGEGTLGQLLTNDELYDQLNRAMKNVDVLLQDIRLNPSRYTTILRKKRTDYTLPEDDPAFKNGEEKQEEVPEN